MQSQYFYRDNWHGNKRDFRTLGEAIKNAKGEDGTAITIFRTKDSRIMKIVDANGHNNP